MSLTDRILPSSIVYHRLIYSTQSVGAMLWSMAQLRRGQLRMVVDVVGSCWWCGQLSVLARHTHMLHCPPVPTSSWKLCNDRSQFAVCLGSSSVFDSVLRYIISRVRVSFRPRHFLNAKKPQTIVARILRSALGPDKQRNWKPQNRGRLCDSLMKVYQELFLATPRAERALVIGWQEWHHNSARFLMLCCRCHGREWHLRSGLLCNCSETHTRIMTTQYDVSNNTTNI